MAGAEQVPKSVRLTLGPRHPATQFLLRLAAMAIVAVICDLSFPDGAYKTYIILACFVVSALWLYMEASQIASVQVNIDPKRNSVVVERQFILARKVDAIALADVAGLDISWSATHSSIEAQDYSMPTANSVVLTTKDGRRIVLVAPSHMNSLNHAQIEMFENAFNRALGRWTG